MKETDAAKKRTNARIKGMNAIASYTLCIMDVQVAQPMMKPLTVLSQAMNKNVIVELKGKREYRGVLDGYDPHMNIVLKNAEEIVNGQSMRKLSLTIVRGDNVIYISP